MCSKWSLRRQNLSIVYPGSSSVACISALSLVGAAIGMTIAWVLDSACLCVFFWIPGT
jgi:hypothetical protein